jgi:FtsP/CotA-like multicopper oxidase with cupredoxin domain
MKTRAGRCTLPILVGLAVGAVPAASHGEILGLTGTSFSLFAKRDTVITGEGNSLLLWGYARSSTGRAQYPGPTLIVNQNDVVTVTLTNSMPSTGTSSGHKASIVFPGQNGVVATCMGNLALCTDGLLTKEVARLGVVQYTFTASRPGTYVYHSGTRPELQIEMGLVGVIIVRPTGYNPSSPTAYGDGRSAYDREGLFLLTEMDARIHDTVQFQGVAALASTDYLSDYFSGYWFINGRNAPDSMAVASSLLYPTQPYNAVPRMHPGEKFLMRVANLGRQMHPFHHHGNHARILAKDGRLLESVPGAGLATGVNAGPDGSFEVFTIQSIPGETVDAIFQWTGKDLGWDIYGHAPGDDLEPEEWAPDHGKPFPVTLPEQINLTFGGFWTGSPFLGVLGSLPPGEGGLNPTAGYVFMWHSHTEKELTNYDIFPGGMMTFMIVEHPDVAIP